MYVFVYLSRFITIHLHIDIKKTRTPTNTILGWREYILRSIKCTIVTRVCLVFDTTDIDLHSTVYSCLIAYIGAYID